MSATASVDNASRCRVSGAYISEPNNIVSLILGSRIWWIGVDGLTTILLHAEFIASSRLCILGLLLEEMLVCGFHEPPIKCISDLQRFFR